MSVSQVEFDRLEAENKRMRNCQNCGWWDDKGQRCVEGGTGFGKCMFFMKWKSRLESTKDVRNEV